MSKTVRCKFQVDEVGTRKGWGSSSLHYFMKAHAVTGGGEENQTFFAATPAGSFDVGVVAPGVIDHLKPGDEFYIDIVKA